MDSEDSGTGTIDGLSLDAAVERVVAADDSRDPETVRRRLSHVTETETVTSDVAEETLKELSKLVTTAESRTEFAEIALDDAREAAEPVRDLDAVASRLDGYAARLEAIESRETALGGQLQRVVSQDTDDLYDLAVGIHEVTEASHSVQMDADDLQLELEAFERWLDSPTRRHESLAEEVEAIAESFEVLGEAADAIDAGEGDQLARRWADTTLRHRLTRLLLDDCRAELADLRAWPGVEGSEELDALETRLDAVGETAEALAGQLDRIAQEEWETEFGESIAEFETELSTFEPPVDWGAVQATFERHRPV